jgi:choline/glycine/proline betaine transport protein
VFSLYKGLRRPEEITKRESQKDLENYEEIVSDIVKTKIVLVKTKLNNPNND